MFNLTDYALTRFEWGYFLALSIVALKHDGQSESKSRIVFEKSDETCFSGISGTIRFWCILDIRDRRLGYYSKNDQTFYKHHF